LHREQYYLDFQGKREQQQQAQVQRDNNGSGSEFKPMMFQLTFNFRCIALANLLQVVACTMNNDDTKDGAD